MRITIINGSKQGASEKSNTLVLLKLAEKHLISKNISVLMPHQKIIKSTYQKKDVFLGMFDVMEVVESIRISDGIIIGTGNYWGQTSSILQMLIEELTYTEGMDIWLGKPVGIIITEHSSGGQGILSNLATVFRNLGALVVGGMVYSFVGQEAIANSPNNTDDVWGLKDVTVICDNVISYARNRANIDYSFWNVERVGSQKSRWVK